MDYRKKTGTDSLNSFVERQREAVAVLGRAGMHALLPDLFEYYMCSLELLSDGGETKGFLMFPVMPSNIVETKTSLVSIQKTQSGIVTLFNKSFAPRDISIQGTFGRKVRLITGVEVHDDESSWFTKAAMGDMGFGVMGNNLLIKTGYGLIKMMERMTDRLYEMDEMGRPHIMVFTNYALNTQYVVEILQRSFTQSQETNAIWYYNLEMKAIAPGDSIKKQGGETKPFWKSVLSNTIAQTIDKILTDVARSAMQF